MNQQFKFNNFRYFSWVVVFIEWSLVFLLFQVFNFSTDMPISQVTAPNSQIVVKYIAVIAIILATSAFYIFSLYLNNFWDKASKISVIGGLFMTLTMTVPYNTGKILTLLHGLLALVALAFYLFTVMKVSYSSLLNKKFRYFTNFVLASVAVCLSIIIMSTYNVEIFNSWRWISLVMELVVLLSIHIWMIAISSNYLLRFLRHLKLSYR
jgi:hypothetical protein